MDKNNNKNDDVWKIFDDLFADFDSVFGSGPIVGRGPGNGSGRGLGRCNMGELYHTPNFPPVNVFINEESKDLTFEFAIAGYNKKDVDVAFEGDKMTLSLKENDNSKEGLKPLKRGFKRPGTVTSFIVPSAKYETENAEADVEDGVLTIRIPAMEKIKPKKLIIK